MLKKIESDKLHLTVDTHGAYIEEFSKEGVDVFLTKREVPLKDIIKVRGGSHICLPHFGPSSKVNQENHGYGRDYEWEVLEESDSELVLKLQEDIEGYEGMIAIMTYTLDGNKFITDLKVKNEGNHTITVSPAFHPYFAIKSKDDVKVDGEKVEFGKKLSDSTLTGDVDKLETGNHTITFETENMDKYIIWADDLAEYICVEPSFNHKALDEDKELVEIQAGDQAHFSFTLTVE